MANKQDLPDNTREDLLDVLAQDPESLSEGDRRFLRARSAYLEKEEKEKFADVLEGDESADTDDDTGDEGDGPDSEDTDDETETEEAEPVEDAGISAEEGVSPSNTVTVETEDNGEEETTSLQEADRNDLFAEIDRLNDERDGADITKSGDNDDLVERIKRARNDELTDEDLKS